MSGIIDDELYEISNDDLWELFTGRRQQPYSFREGSLGKHTLVTQRDTDAIRNAVANARPSSRGNRDLLLLMWIREMKFGKAPLHDDNLCVFFKDAFNLTETSVSEEGIRYKIEELLNSGDIERKDERLGNRWGNAYHLSMSAKRQAKKRFNELILKTETYEEDTELTEEEPQETIEQTIPSSFAATSELSVAPPIPTALTGVGVPDIVEGYQEYIEEPDGTPANVNVVNQLTKADIANGVAEGIKMAWETSEPLPPDKEQIGGKKTRNTVSDSQYHAAIKLVIDEKLPQSRAEEKCGLWVGALSKGKGAKMLDEAEKAIADISRRQVKEDSENNKGKSRKDIGDDYFYNEVLNNDDN